MILFLVKAWLVGKLLDSLGRDVFGRGIFSPGAPGPAPAPGGGAVRSPVPPTTRRPTPGAAAVAPPGAAPRPAPTVQARMPATSAPPWPQVKPEDLPAFPGPGWEPDHPPPSAVVQRSMALLPILWDSAHGERWVKIEQTAGRWIAYQATRMPGGVKGVVAWRMKGQGMRSAPAAAPASTQPASHVVTLPETVITPRDDTVPASTSRPAQASTALPTLRRGSRGSDVALLQRHLGIKGDGIFGPQTEANVRAYQKSHGLVADGIVGPKTWGSLLGAGQAA